MMSIIERIKRSIKQQDVNVFHTRDFLKFGSRSAVSATLKTLVQKGNLFKIGRGKFIKNKSQQYKERALDSATENATRYFLAIITERYEIANAMLFGSRARGDYQQYSDVDVAIFLHGKRCQRRLPVKLDMAKTAFDVMLETDIRISPYPIWLNEWEHPETHPNPMLLNKIAKEGILL